MTPDSANAKTSPWADVLATGVNGWSSFSDTGSGESPRVVEDGPAHTSARDGAERSTGPDGAGGRGAGKPSASDANAIRRDASKSFGDGVASGAPSGTGGGNADANAGNADANAGEGGKSSKDKKDKSGALDVSWKQYRRDVEWQCKWLELRMKEVNGHVTRYERMLRAIEAAKKRDAEASRRAGSSGGAPVYLAAAAKKAEAAAKEAEGVAAEVDAESGGLGTPRRANGGGVRMKRRWDHTGHTPPPAPVLITHPLFAHDAAALIDGSGLMAPSNGKVNGKALTAGDLKRRKKAAAAVAAAAAAAAAAARAKNSGSDSDLSTAALYEQIEVLQQRVTALHARLGQPAPSMGPTGNVHAIKRNAAAGRGGGYGANEKKSRKTDYDINDVVGADATGAKFVERAHCVEISVPNVRDAPTYSIAPIVEERGLAAAEAAAAAAMVANEGGVSAEKGAGGGKDDGDDTSSEDTSDDAFMLRHQKFEIAERKARTLPDKKSRGGEKNSGHGNGSANPKSGDKSPTTGTGDGGGSSPR